MRYVIIILMAISLSACFEKKPPTLGQCVDKLMAHFKVQETAFMDLIAIGGVCIKEQHDYNKIIKQVEEELEKGNKK